MSINTLAGILAPSLMDLSLTNSLMQGATSEFNFAAVEVAALV